MESQASGVEGTFETRDGSRLRTLSWSAEGSARAHVAFVHGFGEHIGRYGHIAERLSARGVSAVGYDQRGHGRSPGRIGYIPAFDALVKDCGEFIEFARSAAPGLPYFIFAHSMGSLVLAHTILEHQPAARGVVFSSPAFYFPEVSPILRALSGLLSRLVPRLPVEELDTKAISRDPGEVRAYEADPLVHHGKITARTGTELLNAADRIRPRLHEIRHPFIALHGGADELAPCRSSTLLHEMAESDDKTLRIYDDAVHEIFNDLDRERFFEDVLDWLERRIDSDSSGS